MEVCDREVGNLVTLLKSTLQPFRLYQVMNAIYAVFLIITGMRRAPNAVVNFSKRPATRA